MHKKLCSGLFCGKTILNALRFRSGHIQRKNYFYFAILENLRIFQNCLFTGGVITESGSCRAGFLWKHSRGGVNVLLVFSGLNPLRSWHAAGVTERVLPASTSLSSTTPAHENGVQKHPQAFLDPKIKNIISLAYAQSNAERIQNRPTQQESAFCFTPSSVQSPQGLLPPRRR